MRSRQASPVPRAEVLREINRFVHVNQPSVVTALEMAPEVENEEFIGELSDEALDGNRTTDMCGSCYCRCHRLNLRAGSTVLQTKQAD
jgi:hypothetical protein